MLYGSDNGGWTAAVLTSAIATAKPLALDPFTYLRDLFESISDHLQNRLAELLPDQWRMADAVKVAERKEDKLHGPLPTALGDDLGL